MSEPGENIGGYKTYFPQNAVACDNSSGTTLGGGRVPDQARADRHHRRRSTDRLLQEAERVRLGRALHREGWAKQPEILKAIATSEKAWRELDDDRDE